MRSAISDSEVTQQDIHTGSAGFPGGGQEGTWGLRDWAASREPFVGQEETRLGAAGPGPVF